MSDADRSLDVSVVIPAYNRADYIAETLENILAQTYRPREIIVVDDGSTDDTATVLAQFGNRITVIRTPNQGVQAARNTGIEHATTEWIALCDSDDIWLPTFLEAQVALLRAAPEVQFCFGNFRYLRDDVLDPRDKFSDAPPGYWDINPRRTLPEGWVFEGSIAPQTVGFHPIFPSAMVFSKTLIQAVGLFDPRLRGMRAEDGEFSLRCLYYGRTGATPEPLVTIRRHADNFSGDAVQVLIGEVQALSFVKKNHPGALSFHGIIDKAISDRRIAAFDGAFAQKDHALARTLFHDIPSCDCSPKLRLKRLVAALPDVISLPINSLLQRLTGMRVARPGSTRS